MANCFNCKHRHHMICIPESNDCEKVYLLDDHDVFEVNTGRCDFYSPRDRVYDYSSHHGRVRFTRDIFYKEIYDQSGPFSREFSFDKCMICINGIVYDYRCFYRNIITIIDTKNTDDKGLPIFEISIGTKTAIRSICKHKFVMHCKCITIHKEDDMIIVNGLNFLGGEE